MQLEASKGGRIRIISLRGRERNTTADRQAQHFRGSSQERCILAEVYVIY